VIVQDIIAACHLKIQCGEEYLNREVTVTDINRPGLALAGYLEHFDCQRIQVIGMTELSFLHSLDTHMALNRFGAFIAMGFPCLVITRNLVLPDSWSDLAENGQVLLLNTDLPTTQFISILTDYLDYRLAPSSRIHGVFLDVHGVGVLITGESGVGKSETALELIHRGHRLIADDAVDITRRGPSTLIGTAPDRIRYLIEIRGLGILDVKMLFGTGAIRQSGSIDLVIQLEEWQQGKYYDRLGIDEEKTIILDVPLPYLTIPVRPGRNLAAIVEVAAMNYRQKILGYKPALRFN
jgi:HPr kinase/phosphorylase